MTTTRPSSFWCDVFAHPAGLGFVYCTGPGIADCRTVVVEVNGTVVDTLVAPDTPRMIRAAASPTGELCFVGQAQNGGGALIYQDGLWRFNEWPCYSMPAVSWEHDAFVVWLQATADTYTTVLHGTRGPTLPIPMGVTSSGIRQIVTSLPVWADTVYTTTIRGTTILQYMTVQGVVVGQSPDQPYAVGTPVDVGDPFVALEGLAMDPRLAYSPVLDAYAVCSWTTTNTANLNTLPPFPALPTAPEGPVVYPPIAPFTHAVSIAPFKDPEGTSGADSEVVIDGARQASPSRPCWVSGDPGGGFTAVEAAAAAGTLLGIYTQGTEGLDHVRATADRLGCRIAWLHDGPEVPEVPPQLKTWDQVWIEEYLVTGETVAAARARWTRAEAAALASACHDLGIVPGYYGTFADQATVDAIASSLTTVNTNPRWTMVAPFEYLRANGISDRPAVAEMYHRTLAASVLGVPIFTPMPDVPIPPEPPDPPIQPPIPPDPPIEPPVEVPMPIPPVTSWPFVHQAGKSPVSLTVTAPFAVPHPTSGYEDFQTAIRAVKPDGDYVEGFLGGWAMLSGGAAPDVAAGKALSILHDGARNKNKNNYGQGYTDVYRLLVEKECDVDATLAAQ